MTFCILMSKLYLLFFTAYIVSVFLALFLYRWRTASWCSLKRVYLARRPVVCSELWSVYAQTQCRHNVKDKTVKVCHKIMNQWVNEMHVGLQWVSSVLRPRQHSIGYMRDGFYRSKDPTNSIKVMKEMLLKRKKTTKTTKYIYAQTIM